MVKISIKKSEKTIKPKQKQKQKQSQKVIVNIGRDVIKPRRKRRTGQALEKNKTGNKSNIAPTQINVPQANPLYKQPDSQNLFGELLKYLKETGTKEKEKSNELEKDKKPEAKKQTIEDAQDQFSFTNSQSISSLTSGTSTPNPLSRPVNSRSLFESLMRVADLQGENPNSGRVSLSTSQSSPLLSSSSSSVDPFSVIGVNNSSRSNLSSNVSSIITEPTYNSSDRTYSAPSSSISSVSSTQTSPLPFNSFTSALTDYLRDRQEQPPPMEPPAMEQSTDDEVIDVEQEVNQESPPEEVNDQQIVVFEQSEPEQQIVVSNGPERVDSSATATEITIGKDNSSIPPFLRPMNNPLPRINLKDVINELPGLRGSKADIREARLKVLEAEKKEPEATTPQIISPKKKEDSIRGVSAFIQGSPIKSNQPSKLSDLLKTSPTKTAAEETESSVVGSSIQGYDDFVKYISDAKKVKNGELGNILIKNNITDPKTGNPFYVNLNNKVLVRGTTSTLNRTQLTELLKEKYKPGFNY